MTSSSNVYVCFLILGSPVYLTYNTSDEPTVKEIIERLAAHCYIPFDLHEFKLYTVEENHFNSEVPFEENKKIVIKNVKRFQSRNFRCFVSRKQSTKNISKFFEILYDSTMQSLANSCQMLFKNFVDGNGNKMEIYIPPLLLNIILMFAIPPSHMFPTSKKYLQSRQLCMYIYDDRVEKYAITWAMDYYKIKHQWQIINGVGYQFNQQKYNSHQNMQ